MNCRWSMETEGR